MRSIRESERETDYWKHIPPSSGQTCQADKTDAMEDSLSSPHPAEHDDLRGRRQWPQVPAQHSRCFSSVTLTPSQVPLHKRYEALQVGLTTRKVVQLGWRCHQGQVCLCPASKLLQQEQQQQQQQEGHCNRRLFCGEQKAQYTDRTHFLGKLVYLEAQVHWYGPWIIVHYYFISNYFRHQ